MIRQAISCDICATEKKQTNHWFVAYEQGGELRVSGWHSRNRLRPGSKHLCGQTCLHKLVDEFFAKAIAMRSGTSAAADQAEVHDLPEVRERVVSRERATVMDTSLTSDAAYIEVESSARLITPPARDASAAAPAAAPAPVGTPSATPKTQTGLVTMPGRAHTEALQVPPEEPRFASRSWRAEAWERERQRELRAVETRPDVAARRRSRA